MNDRAARGGGVATPLAGLASTVAASAATGSGANWFGPLVPVAPIAPAEVAGRTWDYPAAYNLNTRPRPYEPVTFATLRALADGYDILRLAIETRKDQMARQKWAVVLKDEKAKATADQQKRIDAATAFFAMPYPGVRWSAWLRRLMEDLLVFDAPAIYRRKNAGGGLYGYKPLAGSTINRLLDPWGDEPQAPDAAYVQILKGLGAVHYTSDELLYRPRNVRNEHAFGYGPVEQIIGIVSIALRRESWQLSYFTDGNIPDALIGVPNEWSPTQVRDFQTWFDNRLAGNTGKRRGATFVPGDVAKSMVQTKETELFGKGEEWIARVICYAFNLPPSWPWRRSTGPRPRPARKRPRRRDSRADQGVDRRGLRRDHRARLWHGVCQAVRPEVVLGRGGQHRPRRCRAGSWWPRSARA